jgi:RNA polymerase sigma-32 factor
MGLGRPSTNTHENLLWHLREIRACPLLGSRMERALWHRWRDRHDIFAAHELARKHLHLVGKIAERYGGFGVGQQELIGESYVGLMYALCRFDPNHGVRFASYATWCVRSIIHDYILRNWSRMEIGSTSFQNGAVLESASHKGTHHQEFNGSTLKSEHVSRSSNLPRALEHGVISIILQMADRDRSLDLSIGAEPKACRAEMALVHRTSDR